MPDQALSNFGRQKNSSGGLLNSRILGPSLRAQLCGWWCCPWTAVAQVALPSSAVTVREMNLEKQFNISKTYLLPTRFSPACPNLVTFAKSESMPGHNQRDNSRNLSS